DADAKKGHLDLTSLKFNAENTAVWIKIHDVVERGEMPPKKKKRPDPDASRAFLGALDSRLVAATSTAETGRIRMRRLTRREFENTLCAVAPVPTLIGCSLLKSDSTRLRICGKKRALGLASTQEFLHRVIRKKRRSGIMAGRIGYVKRMKRAPHPVCKTALKAPKRSRD
ncbi:MAG: hypothetical protein EBU74_10110, partial [Betaproteobacteria bacterium]|nr:hypothetical protein [Betaproteobacteria bacterium]